MELTICQRCYNACHGPISTHEIEFDPENHDGEECVVCDDPITNDFFTVYEIELGEAHTQELVAQIYGCDFQGCAVVGDSEGEVWNDTTSTLWEALSEVVEKGARVARPSAQQRLHGIPHASPRTHPEVHDHLLSLALEGGCMEVVPIPDGFSCPNCGGDLEDWYRDVKQLRFVVTLHIPGDIPAAVSVLPEEPDHASFIEYFRADCSRFLVHLTKEARVVFAYNNVDFEPEERECTAAEVLWAILQSKRIKANKGKGMARPAVCLTEKPLIALKETLIGHEASRRRGKAITWSPYGLMFEKNYAHGRGAVPVLPCSRAEIAALPEDVRFRAVNLSAGSNWLHEREWRCRADFEFDLAEAVVLVPSMEQIEAFRTALDRRGLRVRGFLPLFDLFAFV